MPMTGVYYHGSLDPWTKRSPKSWRPERIQDQPSTRSTKLGLKEHPSPGDLEGSKINQLPNQQNFYQTKKDFS